METVIEHRAGLPLFQQVWDLSLENSNGWELESSRHFLPHVLHLSWDDLRSGHSWDCRLEHLHVTSHMDCHNMALEFPEGASLEEESRWQAFQEEKGEVA